MRNIIPHRFVGEGRDDDVQTIINEKPSTVVVTRMTGSAMAGTKTSNPISTFECRIDPMDMGARVYPERDLGRGANVSYRLVAKHGTDRLGNPVLIQNGDTATIDGVAYRVIYVHDQDFMVEATIETTQ